MKMLSPQAAAAMLRASDMPDVPAEALALRSEWGAVPARKISRLRNLAGVRFGSRAALHSLGGFRLRPYYVDASFEIGPVVDADACALDIAD